MSPSQNQPNYFPEELSGSQANSERLENRGQNALGEVLFKNIGASEIAYRMIGSGDPLLLIHGWPLSGMTFRKIIPALASHFTCYVIDLPGSGETRWTDRTDFGFKNQAKSVKAFVDQLDLKSYSLLAHDTGATIGRQIAIIDPNRIKKVVAIGTEIPHHRPPWIPLYQGTSYLPGNNRIFRLLMQSDAFVRSPMGLGGCFFDLNLLKGEFHNLFIEPLIRSPQWAKGQQHCLRGIDWALIDSLAVGHWQIQAPVLLIWGEDDQVFPVELAKEMVPQFKDCRGLKVIPKARLFVHEEQPDLVAQSCLEFLLD